METDIQDIFVALRVRIRWKEDLDFGKSPICVANGRRHTARRVSAVSDHHKCREESALSGRLRAELAAPTRTIRRPPSLLIFQIFKLSCFFLGWMCKSAMQGKRQRVERCRVLAILCQAMNFYSVWRWLTRPAIYKLYHRSMDCVNHASYQMHMISLKLATRRLPRTSWFSFSFSVYLRT